MSQKDNIETSAEAVRESAVFERHIREHLTDEMRFAVGSERPHIETQADEIKLLVDEFLAGGFERIREISEE